MRRPSLSRLATVALGSVAAFSLVGADAPGGKKPLTLERISSEPPLATRGMLGPAWRDGTHFSYVVREGTGPDAKSSLWEYDAATGLKTKLLDPVSVPTPTLSKTEERAKEKQKTQEAKPKTLPSLPLMGATWNPAGTGLLLRGEGDLWFYDFGRKALTRLTRDEAEEEHATFSPDGSHVAYVKKHDLFVVDLVRGNETRLTTTGAEHVFNGHLDWVYEEELANRRSGRSYEWSPDGKSLVYLRLDENRVPEYPIVDFLPTNGKLMPQRYPKAGDPNAIPSVHVVDLTGKETATVDFTPDDLYVAPEFSWTADSAAACFLVLNRAQTTLDVKLLPRAGGPAKALFTENDPAWINSIEPPHFLKDGSGFLFLSERSGYLHLYRYGMDGTLKNAVTRGDWMVDGSPDVDEKSGSVFLVATEKDPRERHLYRVGLDGAGIARLSQEKGTHTLKLAPGGAFYLDGFSNATTPPTTTLHRGDGTAVAVVDEPKGDFHDYALGTVELSSFKGNDGTLFYTRLVKPPDFDPTKKYPVVVSIYGGPHAQVVRDSWGITSAFDGLLASKGFLVWSLDNRGSWGRGHAFETPLLKRMGERELKDQLEGIAELQKLPFVDRSRIGIWGWSYGGYMTLYAATHAGETFKCAVAGAPVTDWKFYDSIYTERYMKLPKDNADGYAASSPLQAAGKLGPRLLILHGTSDDNVHMQNTMAFVDALMRARRDYVFVPLPRQKHGPRDPAARLYTNQRILEFFERNL